MMRARLLLLATVTLVACAFAPGRAGAQPCDPSGLYAMPVLVPEPEPQRKVSIADLNGDGLPDLVVSTTTRLEVRVATLVGGVVQYPLTFQQPMGVDPTNVAIADFNSDGLLDIMVARTGGALIQLQAHGAHGVWDGTFTEIASYGVGSAWDVVAVDVTGDGILDLVTSTSEGIKILAGTGSGGHGDGGFTPLITFAKQGGYKGLAVVDVDGDGALDIVAGTEGPSLALFRGERGASGPTHNFLPPQVLPVDGGVTYDVAVADLDGDGRLDIACTTYLGHTVAVLLQVADGSFQPAIQHAAPGTPLGLRAADVDRDGYPDLVVGAAGAGTFSVLVNQGPAGTVDDHLNDAILVGPTRTTYGLDVADLNGDTAMDVVAAGIGENTLAIFNGGCTSGLVPLFTAVQGGGHVDRAPNAAAYAPGTVVTLTAVGAIGWDFVDWAGDASGSQNPITLQMDVPHFVTARFESVTHTLTVTVVGQGSVTRSPDAASYPAHSNVHLTATPAFGSAFAGWSGDVEGTDRAIDLLMEKNEHVTATFVTDTLIAPRIESVVDTPGDEGGHVLVRWRASSLEDLPPVDPHHADHYWLWREIPDAGFAALAAAARDAGARPVRLRTRAGAQDRFWEFVAEAPASGVLHYNLVAPTANDSTEFGNPFTAFMVQARDVADTTFFDSQPDSGYSVDDLAPAAPALATLSRAGGRNALHWSASAARDVAAYAIHRGGSATFTAEASNRIAETADTTFTDGVRGSAFYKVVAVDRHGNRGAAVLASPAPGSGALGFGIDAVFPNPSPGGRMSVTFVLGSDEPATLELLDVMGRRAGDVVRAPSAGVHTVRFGETTRVRPGLYWLRLTQGAREVHVRVAVTD